MIYTILKNLIENGIKFNKSETPTITLRSKTHETYKEIIIKDNGIGIDAAYHEQVFKMFKRLHNRAEYEGSGIGLAIVKLLADKLGGTIRVESELGKGSTFTLRFPQKINQCSNQISST
ncbi:MAG: ATP-binding protein [Saprospiraceae bacterium]